MGLDPTAPVSLGRHGVTVSRLGLGTAAFGGLYEHVDAAEATAVVKRAVAAGIAYVDTAPHYGAGAAETRLGGGLAHLAAGSQVPTISTKVGRLLRDAPDGAVGMFADADGRESYFDFGADAIRRSLDESLERLGRDRVDIVYLHDPDDHVEQALDEAYPVLHRLREEGVIGAIGVGMNQTAVPARFVRETDLDVVLLAGRYTLLDRTAEAGLLPACRERGVPIVVGGVLNSGLLADAVADARYDYGPASAEQVGRAQRLRDLCASYGVPLRAAALQFPLREASVASVLLGCRSVAELDDCLAMVAIDVPDELWEALC